MDSTTPIPVAIFGKDPKLARAVCEKLLPDFDTVHVCLDLPSALAELPALFSPSGQPPPAPASGLGTNAYTLDPAKRRAKVPRAVFFGGKFTDDEYDAVVDAVQKAAAAATATTSTTTTNTSGGGYDDDDADPAGFRQQPVRGGTSSTSSTSTSSDRSTGSNDHHHHHHHHQQVQQQVHFIKVQKRDVLAAGALGPNPDVICKVFRKKMAAALDRERDRDRDRARPDQRRRLRRRRLS
ncbi:uncharacterized protein P884DRAFT_301855 [Thermothelomyces heterothallicus CBS 202.75]|uniref:uncharacterized protein n=1 Tax=Thermothelomyces heterothallicus CBS 202.75 TaxID=1149848 RepID=UPI00374438B0